MAYTKTAWLSGIAPPISAANLNNLETQYDEALATIRAVSVIKQVDESETTNEVMQSDDELLLPLAINTTYAFVLTLYGTAATATPGCDFTFTVPSGATGGFIEEPGTGSIFNDIIAFATERGIPGDFNTSGLGQIYGIVVTGGTAGNLQFQWAQGTSDGTPTIIKAGSTLTLYG